MNIITKAFKRAVRWILYGYKSSSKLYLQHLRAKGMRVGDGTRLFSSETISIDETAPSMIVIGRNVQLTGGGNYTLSRLRLGSHKGGLWRCFRLCKADDDRK